MGKPINKHTKNLNELLDHIKEPADDLDAFEQEALEGFASLENEQEALDMKTRLDKRINEELFEKKKQPLFIYWSAAAGVTLLVGLIFLFKSTNTIESKDMAMNTAPKEEVQPLEFKPAPGSSDKITDELKVEDKYEGKKVAKDAKGNLLNEQSIKQNKTVDQENVNSLAAADANSEVAKPAEENYATARSKESETEKDLEDSKRSEPAKAATASSYGQSSGAGAANAPVVTTKNEKSDEAKSGETKSRIVAKEKKKSAAPESAPSQMDRDDRAEHMAAQSNTIKTAVLTITAKDLEQKIDAFMSDKDYKKSFECTLTINNANEVQEVVFENNNLFKRAQAKEITAFLKKLNCFKNSEYAVYSTYKLNYTAK